MKHIIFLVAFVCAITFSACEKEVPEISNQEICPNDEIWYSSADNNIIKPTNTDAFDANIVSNTYENGKGIIKFDSEIKAIGHHAFYKCSNLTSVIIPESITSIGYISFGECDNLLSFTIPDNVTDIDHYAFMGCHMLKSITIPDSVINIHSGAFSECSQLKAFYGKFATTDNRCLIVNDRLVAFAPYGLTYYTIPDNVKSIIEVSFTSCKNLSSITIPANVTWIGWCTFLGCSNLKYVYCEPTTPPAGNSNMFDFINEAAKIYVPIGSAEAYKAADFWKNYADLIEEKEM